RPVNGGRRAVPQGVRGRGRGAAGAGALRPWQGPSGGKPGRRGGGQPAGSPRHFVEEARGEGGGHGELTAGPRRPLRRLGPGRTGPGPRGQRRGLENEAAAEGSRAPAGQVVSNARHRSAAGTAGRPLGRASRISIALRSETPK